MSVRGRVVRAAGRVGGAPATAPAADRTATGSPATDGGAAPGPEALGEASLSWLVFDRAPNGIVLTSADGYLRLVNPAFARMLGYQPCELVGRHFSDITDPRDLTATVAALGKVLDGTSEELQVDKRYIRADGRRVWVRTSAALIRDPAGLPVGVIAQSADISRRRAAEQRLHRSEACLNRIFDVSAVAKALLDTHGRTVRVNQAMLTLTGHSRSDELSGEQLVSHVLAPQDTAVRDLCRSHRGDAQFEARLRRADGSIATVLCLTGAATSASGSPLTVVQIVDISDRKAAEETATFRSLHDELTGLANRRLFVDTLDTALADRRTVRQKTAVLMVDLDRFKEVNDGFGHSAGDDILIEVARRLKAVTRRADTVGRVGGDEFWVVARDVGDDVGAITVATAILRELSLAFAVGTAKVHVGASVGFSLAPDDGTTAGVLMSKADSAQYRAKTSSSSWAAYTKGPDEQRLDLLELAADLRVAIDGEELDIVYQPLFAARGRITGFEALSRWNHPERGAISPDVFVALAEHAKLMPALTRMVLRRATRQCAQWRAGGRDVTIAVNLAASLLRDDTLLELVTAELAAAGLDPDHLTLEITEGRLADGSDPVVSKTLDDLHRLGIRLSIDDFGTGYSSLAYLKELPVDELKVDKSFVVHLDIDSRDVAIVRSLVDLAKILQLDVVAEGVESEGVAAHLREAGCDILQGFGLGRPQSAAQATALLAEEAATEAIAVQAPPPALARSLVIVLADDDPRSRIDLSQVLAGEDHHVVRADNAADVIAKVRSAHVDLVILTPVIGRGQTGVQASAALRAAGYHDPIVILFTLAPNHDVGGGRFPIDVWPVAKEDRATLLHLVAGCATRVRPAGPADADRAAAGPPTSDQAAGGGRTSRPRRRGQPGSRSSPRGSAPASNGSARAHGGSS